MEFFFQREQLKVTQEAQTAVRHAGDGALGRTGKQSYLSDSHCSSIWYYLGGIARSRVGEMFPGSYGDEYGNKHYTNYTAERRKGKNNYNYQGHMMHTRINMYTLCVYFKIMIHYAVNFKPILNTGACTIYVCTSVL